MKRLILVLSLLLSVFIASGQHHHAHGRHSDRQEFRVDDHHRHGGFENRRVDVLCVRDHQELWNGCHVKVNHFGVSVLARSTCLDELRNGKLALLSIEGLSMERSTNIICRQDFEHPELIEGIAEIYHEMQA